MEQQQLQRQIQWVQELQILSHDTILGHNNQQQLPVATFNIYEDGHIEVVSSWLNTLQVGGAMDSRRTRRQQWWERRLQPYGHLYE